MASPNAIATEIVTTTFRDHGKNINDIISNSNALYERLNKKGHIDLTYDGGHEIFEPIEYDENSTYQRYSGYDKLNIAPSDVFSGVTYDPKMWGVAISISGEQMLKNSGKNRIIPLMKSRIKNAIKSKANNESQDMYSDGTASKQMGGLQLQVADAGTGTVGGINSSTYSWWQNTVQSAASPLSGGGAVTVGSTTIQELMMDLWMETTRGRDGIDLIVADNTYYRYYWQSLTALERYTSEDGEGRAPGFKKLKFMDADVVYDGGSNFNSGIPANRMYFLNTDYLKMKKHKDANCKLLPELRPNDQHAFNSFIFSMGNLIGTNRQMQGVLKP